MPTYNFLFTPFKFPKSNFYGLGLNPFFTQGKSRHCGLDPQSQELTYATPYQVRGDILEIWVHQKTILVQFEIYFSTNFQPPRFSIVWLKAQPTFCLLPMKLDNKILPTKLLIKIQHPLHTEFFALKKRVSETLLIMAGTPRLVLDYWRFRTFTLRFCFSYEKQHSVNENKLIFQYLINIMMRFLV